MFDETTPTAPIIIVRRTRAQALATATVVILGIACISLVGIAVALEQEVEALQRPPTPCVEACPPTLTALPPDR